MPAPLSTPDVEKAVSTLAGWSRSGDAIEKTFTFPDFSAALGFIVRVGVEAERLNHHPNLTNVWNRVTLRLNTHDAGDKVTERDVALAKAVEKLSRD
jgi:4a-hydroxytetrahydrobiopterin dehydratase